MDRSDVANTGAGYGSLRPSRRSYYWLFAWFVVAGIWLAGMIRWQGPLIGPSEATLFTTVICGYMFFIDISHKVWWTPDQISWRGWDYLSIKQVRHSVRVGELTRVVTANNPGNWMPGRPFDRILFQSNFDTVAVLPSFHRREELEELLRLVQRMRPEAVSDPQVIKFMDGAFTDWWPYR